MEAPDTGMLYYPHYLNVGSALLSDEVYNTKTLAELDFGELEDVLSPKELLELTTDTAAAPRPDRGTILGAVQDAESEFDSYVSSRYPVPIRTSSGLVPREAKAKCKLLFKYYLYARRTSIPPDIRRHYDDAIQFLTAVSRGVADIPSLIVEEGKAREVEDIHNTVGGVYRGTDTFGSRRTSNVRNERRGFDYYGD